MAQRIDDRIQIVEHDDSWRALFQQEKARILEAVGPYVTDVVHVGSTAVPGLDAKPVIDIMIGLRKRAEGQLCIAPLEALGYDYLGEAEIPGRYFFRKRTDHPAPGQVLNGVGRTHHLHMYVTTHSEWDKHLLFRNYLRNHPPAAAEYAALKRRLAAEHPTDGNAYAEGKNDFVAACVEKARREPTYLVEIADYDPRWPQMFAEEKARILDAIGEWVVDLQHVGSTSVPGLAAKPIIDMMPGLRRLEDAQHCIAPLEKIGYEYVPQYNALLPERRYFQKGYPRTHHLHMVETGGAFWNRHIFFRDYLRTHREAAQAYADLKRGLAQTHALDRFAYTDAKTEFIQSIEAKAREAAKR